MNKKILFVVFLLFVMGITTVFTSCSKDDDEKVSLIGTWKVFGYEGTMPESEIVAIYCMITEDRLSFSKTNSITDVFEKYAYTYDASKQLIYAYEIRHGETSSYADEFHVVKLTSNELWLELNKDDETGKYDDLYKYKRIN